MTKLSAVTSMMLLLAAHQETRAANWLELQGNEPAGSPSATAWGFVQAQYVRNDRNAVNGIAAPAGLTPYNGKTATFNMVAPDNDRSEKLQMFRGRLGVRGVVPDTDEKVNYFVLTEFGHNGLTTEKQAVFTDASVTFNHIPGARIRAGLFKTPTGEEGLQAIHIADYINFSMVTDNLLNERFVIPYTTSRTTAPVLGVPLSLARTTGATSGYRDTGVQIYNWIRHDQWEGAYALMVGNGHGINFTNDNSHYDSSARLQASYIFSGSGPQRQDCTAFIWRQEGKRTFNGSDYQRVREGLGARYQLKPLRISAEYLRGKGMIFVGPNPPFNDAGEPAFEPVTMVAAADNSKAAGYYLDAGYRLSQEWEVDLRYDEFNRLTNSAFDERKYTTWTAGVQYFFNPMLRLVLNYEARKLKVVNPGAANTAAQATQLNDAGIIGDSMGNRFSAQLTWIF